MPTKQKVRRIDWEAWADGAVWVLRPGLDHDQDCRAALKTARMWALKHGMRALADLPPVGAPFATQWRLQFVPRVRRAPLGGHHG